MLVLAFVLSIIGACGLGYWLRDIVETMQDIFTRMDETIRQHYDPPKEEDTGSKVMDPFNVQQQAKIEHDQMIKRLNP